MPKIPATLEKTFRVKASIEDVYSYFADPELRKQDSAQLEKLEKVADNRYRWLIEASTERGITFQPDYIVEYSSNGTDTVSWKGVSGNVDIEGTVSLRAAGGGTEIVYKETMAPDLPINKLLAKVFKPIVSKKVKGGLEEILNKVEARFGKA